MVKIGILPLDHVDVHLDQTGTEFNALTVTVEDNGIPRLFHVSAFQDSGMDLPV